MIIDEYIETATDLKLASYFFFVQNRVAVSEILWRYCWRNNRLICLKIQLVQHLNERNNQISVFAVRMSKRFCLPEVNMGSVKCDYYYLSCLNRSLLLLQLYWKHSVSTLFILSRVIIDCVMPNSKSHNVTRSKIIPVFWSTPNPLRLLQLIKTKNSLEGKQLSIGVSKRCVDGKHSIFYISSHATQLFGLSVTEAESLVGFSCWMSILFDRV